MSFKRFIIYFFYLIVNILLFSFISIYVYQLLCVNTTTIVDLLKYLDTTNLLSFKYYNLNYNYSSTTIKYNFNFLYIINYEYALYTSTIFNTIFDIYILASNLNIFIEKSDFFLYNNIFKIYFFSKIANSYTNIVSFECLQNLVYAYPNESVLVFFRMESMYCIDLECITLYIIYPLKMNFSIIKLQCFCFSNIVIHSNELIELPVLFYVNINNLVLSYKIYIFYILLIF